jgi:hypothetical protein
MVQPAAPGHVTDPVIEALLTLSRFANVTMPPELRTTKLLAEPKSAMSRGVKLMVKRTTGSKDRSLTLIILSSSKPIAIRINIPDFIFPSTGIGGQPGLQVGCLLPALANHCLRGTEGRSVEPLRRSVRLSGISLCLERLLSSHIIAGETRNAVSGGTFEARCATGCAQAMAASPPAPRELLGLGCPVSDTAIARASRNRKYAIATSPVMETAASRSAITMKKVSDCSDVQSLRIVSRRYSSCNSTLRGYFGARR